VVYLSFEKPCSPILLLAPGLNRTLGTQEVAV
jgi:hypothetical protein